MRRILTVVTLVAFLAACTRTVEVPREDIAASAGKSSRRGWQIDTRSGERYRVKSYQLTDSTLVIGELSGTDDLYGSHDNATREIPMSEVASVSRVEISPWAVGLMGLSLLGGVVLLVLLVKGSEEVTAD